mmetsp:Transcript_8793/g.18941  ORF Transcript_8793/g.18941 Transcript_8793/m.18941 type:complete len:335 (+) Transcript_8793:391-1395(+)
MTARGAMTMTMTTAMTRRSTPPTTATSATIPNSTSPTSKPSPSSSTPSTTSRRVVASIGSVSPPRSPSWRPGRPATWDRSPSSIDRAARNATNVRPSRRKRCIPFALYGVRRVSRSIVSFGRRSCTNCALDRGRRIACCSRTRRACGRIGMRPRRRRRARARKEARMMGMATAKRARKTEMAPRRRRGAKRARTWTSSGNCVLSSALRTQPRTETNQLHPVKQTRVRCDPRRKSHSLRSSSRKSISKSEWIGTRPPRRCRFPYPRRTSPLVQPTMQTTKLRPRRGRDTPRTMFGLPPIASRKWHRALSKLPPTPPLPITLPNLCRSSTRMMTSP